MFYGSVQCVYGERIAQLGDVRVLIDVVIVFNCSILTVRDEGSTRPFRGNGTVHIQGNS